MADSISAPPVNTTISVQPLPTPPPNRDTTNVQTELAALPVGTVVEGFVINRDPQNNPILRTPVGDLVIQSDIFLKTGSEVVFRVDATLASRARIVTIDGLDPQDYAAQQTRAPQGDSIAQTALPTALLGEESPVATMTANAPQSPAGIPAVLLTPAAALKQLAGNAILPATPGSAEIPLSPALALLQSGAALKLTITQVVLPTAPDVAVSPPPSPTVAPNALPLPGGNPVPSAPSPVAAAPIPATPGPSPLSPAMPVQQPAAPSAGTQPSSTMTAAPIADPAAALPSAIQASATGPLPRTAPPGAYGNAPTARPGALPSQIRPPVATPPSANARTLPATVIGQDKDGAAIIQSPAGTLKAYTPQKLPTGTQLMIEIEPQDAPQAQPLTPLSDSMDNATSMARDWKTLSDTAGWLQQNAPALSQQFLQQLPLAGPQLSSGLLFFLSAVKNADPRQWLGSRLMDQLESRIPGIADKLGGDMQQLQQLLTGAPKDSWASWMLPIFSEGQLEQARFFYRQDDDRGGKQQGGKSGPNHRFIVELDLSHLGDLQFDGFVRPGERGKQFDLVIRSARMLSPEVSNDIRGLFDTALQTTGYTGYLSFQQGSQYFVRPLAKMQESAGPGAQPILA